MNSRGTFATAINCMDGRVQLPVIEWLKNNHHVDYVDAITEPGPIKILAENLDASSVESISKRISISTDKHGSKLIAVIGHYDCAGNPVDKEAQLLQINGSIRLIQSWNEAIPVIGLWVDESWTVHTV